MGGRLSDSQIAQLQNFFHGRNEVELAFLFGSQARGTAGPLSDVDIAVLIAGNAAGEGPLSYRLVLMGDLATLLHRDDIDVVMLNQAPPLLKHRVARDGRVLFCKDTGIRTKFVVDATREYLDTKPLRKIQEEYLLRRIGAGRFGRPIPYRRVDDQK